VGEFVGGQIIPTESSNILQVEGLALQKNAQTRVILANLSAEPKAVTIKNLPGQVRVRLVDDTNVEAAMHSPEEFRAKSGDLLPTSAGMLPLQLRPYAVARIDA
jgi:hypothetical protein